MDDVLLSHSEFHNPELKLRDKAKENEVQKILQDLVLNRKALLKIQEMVKEEIELGLSANPKRKGLFYMDNTFVTDKLIPNPKQSGDFLSIDLGGTNLRILHVKIKSGNLENVQIKHFPIEKTFRKGNSEKLFDYLAECVDSFLNERGEINKDKKILLGFTFSFGIKQQAIDSAIVFQYSIMTDLPDTVGKDVVQLLQQALERRNLNIKVVALLNDTTALTAMGRFLDPTCSIGLILGSGYNICYFEKVDRIKKINAAEVLGPDAEEVIINTECTTLGDDGSLDFAKSAFDLEIDNESLFPHQISCEKLVGGHYYGEIIRRALIAVVKRNQLLGGCIKPSLACQEVLQAADITAIEGGQANEEVMRLLIRLGYHPSEISQDDIDIVKYVCALVTVRNAKLLAAIVIDHIDKPVVKIAVDGSFYKKHTKLQTLINDFIKCLIPNRNFDLFICEDGSGIGSALVAASC